MTQPEKMDRSDRWAFTWYKEDDIVIEDLDMSCIGYMIWQRERCPETGRLHLQGYIRFLTRKTRNSIKKWLDDNTIHLEKAKNSEEQNIKYCSKEESRVAGPWEWGDPEPEIGKQKQGTRSDWNKMIDDIKNGKKIKELALEYPTHCIRYGAAVEKYLELIKDLPDTIRDIKCMVLWGPPGTGKTHRIRTKYPNAFGVINGRSPWDKYADQEVILFDEFIWMRWTIQEMNMYCDKWTCQLDCRYNDKMARWNKVFIVANTDPKTWWPASSELEKAAFFRRVEVIEVTDIEQKINI